MKEQILYLECFSGISGDMSVSALLDLGADEAVLRAGLESLQVDGYEIAISRTKKCGIDGCHFDVILASEQAHEHHEHHHDHEHCHHDHEHHHHNHDHDHDHEHHHHHHDHVHRNIGDITAIIDGSGLTPHAKDLAKKIFGYVARAEAIAHGLPVEEVHFHEVGAVDSIVDIVGVAICMDNLGFDKVAVSTIYEGQGYVRCQHGLMPVPVPAVVNIAKEGNMTLRITPVRSELVTPTGMAIAAALKTETALPETYTIQKIGVGTGAKDFKHANILRAMVIEADSAPETVTILETNLDDCTGEALSFAMEQLLSAGAKDVFFTPIFMKKNRPATMLSVICDHADAATMEDILFTHLPTIGIRKTTASRTVLPRKLATLDTSFGAIPCKIVTHAGTQTAYPEYEAVKALCLEKGLPFDTTYCKIKTEVMG